MQQLLGVLTEAQRVKRQVSPAKADAVAVRLEELQVNCYADVWGRYADQTHSLLRHGDLEAALGDDRIRRQAAGTARPETLPHGTSAQQARWFRTGFETGAPGACDMFSAASL